MNIQDISTQLLFTTVPLYVDAGAEQRTGTAFILSLPVPGVAESQFPLLVTNYHVVKGAKRGLIELVRREGSEPVRGQRVRVDIEGEALLQHIDVNNDLAMIPIGGLLNNLESGEQSVFFRSIAPELVPTAEQVSALAALEEVTFIGYPSGLYDEANSSPLIRRGITSTPVWNDFRGQPKFLIDAGVFPGSSGSPVFILNQGAYTSGQGLVVGNRLLFLGILSESIQRVETPESKVYLGLGVVTKSHVVMAMAEGVRSRLQPTP